MISKELIFGGYIKNEGGELMDLFIEAVKHHFPNLEMFTSNGYDWPYYAVDNNYASGRNQRYVQGQKLKELTLEDFKLNPKTKVEYVKCEFDKLSDLVTSVENGDSYYSSTHGDGFYESELYSLIALYKHDDPIYRKVEKEVNWKSKVCKILDCSIESLNCWLVYYPGKEEGFVKICHVVAELTGKPEGELK